MPVLPVENGFNPPINMIYLYIWQVIVTVIIINFNINILINIYKKELSLINENYGLSLKFNDFIKFVLKTIPDLEFNLQLYIFFLKQWLIQKVFSYFLLYFYSISFKDLDFIQKYKNIRPNAKCIQLIFLTQRLFFMY